MEYHTKFFCFKNSDETLLQIATVFRHFGHFAFKIFEDFWHCLELWVFGETHLRTTIRRIWKSVKHFIVINVYLPFSVIVKLWISGLDLVNLQVDKDRVM